MRSQYFYRHVHSRQRRGNVAILSAFLLTGLLVVLILAVDMGRIAVAKAEAQRAADAAAIAATWDLLEQGRLTNNHSYLESQARQTAVEYANENKIVKLDNPLDANEDNEDDGDVIVGNFNGYGGETLLNDSDPSNYNAVSVKIRRTQDYLGRIPLFLAPAIGVNMANVSAEATAGFHAGIDGFGTPYDGYQSTLMPFIIHEDAWYHYLQHSNQYPDDYDRSGDDLSVVNGTDGVRELKMFAQGDGSNGNGNGNGSGSSSPGQSYIEPGNWGTVDIGPSGNSTDHLGGQIRNGPSAQDMSHHGGKLEIGENGNFHLTGDTGISGGMAADLTAVIGKPRTIMLYRSSSESGNGTTFEIVGFVGVTVVDYNFQGSDKYIQIQPAVVHDRTALSTDDTTTSFNVYQPPMLIK